MKRQHVPVLRLVGIVFGLTLLVSLVVLIVGLVFRWGTPVQYSNSLFGAGVIFIMLGTLSVTGGFEQRADFSITYAESAGQASISERAQRMVAEINQRYGAMIFLLSTGLLLIAISITIHQLF
jgi:hypothetical protein